MPEVTRKLINDEMEHSLQRDAVFFIGPVVSVEGRRIRIRVDKLKNTAHLLYKGTIVRNIAVGSYVKITRGFIEFIAIVDGEYLQEDTALESEYKREEDKMIRELQVSLIGFIEEGKFERGIQQMPLLGNECFILSFDEFQAIHAVKDPTAPQITLGTLAVEPDQAININVDSLLASHVGIFGTTGSGKSYTLAKIYREIFREFSSLANFKETSQFLLIDFNGEFVSNNNQGPTKLPSPIASGHLKSELILNTTTDYGGDKIHFPQKAIEDLTFWTVLLDATEKTQAPFLARALENQAWAGFTSNPNEIINSIKHLVPTVLDSSDLSKDSNLVVNFLYGVRGFLPRDSITGLNDAIAKFRKNLFLNTTTGSYYWDCPKDASKETKYNDVYVKKNIRCTLKNLEVSPNWRSNHLNTVALKILFQYYTEIIQGHSNREHLSPMIKRMESRIPDIGKVFALANDQEPTNLGAAPLTIVSLKDVNLDMRKVVPLLLCKYMYNEHKERVGRETETKHLNLIIDEAHNILSFDSFRESEAWRDYRLETFEEIIKEGRKFGVFLTIASQRPQDISTTITSQLHNYFVHRLVSQRDIDAIENAVSFLDKASFEMIPILPTGVAILAGLCTQIPVRLKIGTIDQPFVPTSQTPEIAKYWQSADEKPPGPS